MRNTFSETLYQLGKRDPRIFCVVADISPAGSMENFRKEYPERFINVGVAEQVMIGICAGLALRGNRPFAYTIAPFTIYRPFEMVRDDLCYQNLPVTVVGMGSGITYSNLGGTHHTGEDVAIMNALPNMTIFAPCDPQEVINATEATVDVDGPVYLRIGKAGEPTLTDAAPEPYEPGKVRLIREASGAKTAILSFGPIMKMAFDVADALDDVGRQTDVYSVHTLKPLDTTRVAEICSSYDSVVVVEEHSVVGGLGSMVKNIAWDSSATCELKCIGLEDEFIHLYGTYDQLRAAHGLSVEQILAAIS